MRDLFTTWFGPKGPLPEDIPFGPKHVVHKSPIYTGASANRAILQVFFFVWQHFGGCRYCLFAANFKAF
jgi:hypothetical protein